LDRSKTQQARLVRVTVGVRAFPSGQNELVLYSEWIARHGWGYLQGAPDGEMERFSELSIPQI